MDTMAVGYVILQESSCCPTRFLESSSLPPSLGGWVMGLGLPTERPGACGGGLQTRAPTRKDA
jgi:hypothetical protein